MDFEESIPLEDIINNDFLKSDMISEIRIGYNLGIDEETGVQYVLTSNLNNVDEIQAMQGRTVFSDEELENGEKVAIVPGFYGMYAETALGSSIELEGTSYEVIGISSSEDKIYITPKAYKAGKYSVDHLDIALKNQLSSSDSSGYAAELSKAFPTAKFSFTPNDYFDSADSQIFEDFLLVALMFIVLILAFMFLMKFMIDKSNLETVTYTIVGASKKQIMIIYTLQIVILSFVCSLIACALHMGLYDVLFNKINIFPGIKYYFYDYIILILASVIISCLIALPFIFSSMKNSIIQNKNKYNE